MALPLWGFVKCGESTLAGALLPFLPISGAGHAASSLLTLDDGVRLAQVCAVLAAARRASRQMSLDTP